MSDSSPGRNQTNQMNSSVLLLPPRFFSVTQIPSPKQGRGEAGSTRLALSMPHHHELRFPYENGLKGPTPQSGGCAELIAFKAWNNPSGQRLLSATHHTRTVTFVPYLHPRARPLHWGSFLLPVRGHGAVRAAGSFVPWDWIIIFCPF